MAKKKTKETTEVTEIVETIEPVAKKGKNTKTASEVAAVVETKEPVEKKGKKAKVNSEVAAVVETKEPVTKKGKNAKATSEVVEKVETKEPAKSKGKKTKKTEIIEDNLDNEPIIALPVDLDEVENLDETEILDEIDDLDEIEDLDELEDLDDSESQEFDSNGKRGRGRPRKVLTQEEREKILENAKRQRGRPRKEKEEKPEKEVVKEKIIRGRKKVDVPKETHIPLRDESAIIQATLVKKQKQEKAAEQAFIEITPIPPKPNVRYSDEDLAIFEKRIQDFRKESIEELRMLRDRLDDLTNYDFAEESMIYSMHMAEQGSEALEKEKTYAQIQRINEYIKKLDDALQRIKEKTYGICRVCGCLIAKERLLAVPITTLSAAYKIHKKCPEDGIDRIEQPGANNSNGKQ